jgi:hypothetical protein
MILLFEDFHPDMLEDLNEVNQETVVKLNNLKAHYIKRTTALKDAQAKAAERLSTVKERQSKTKDPDSQKIYQARASEEGMTQQWLQTRIEAVTQAAKIVDQKITVANLRLQAKAKRKAE